MSVGVSDAKGPCSGAASIAAHAEITGAVPTEATRLRPCPPTQRGWFPGSLSSLSACWEHSDRIPSRLQILPSQSAVRAVSTVTQARHPGQHTLVHRRAADKSSRSVPSSEWSESSRAIHELLLERPESWDPCKLAVHRLDRHSTPLDQRIQLSAFCPLRIDRLRCYELELSAPSACTTRPRALHIAHSRPRCRLSPGSHLSLMLPSFPRGPSKPVPRPSTRLPLPSAARCLEPSRQDPRQSAGLHEPSSSLRCRLSRGFQR